MKMGSTSQTFRNSRDVWRMEIHMNLHWKTSSLQ